MTDPLKRELLESLEPYGQAHVLRFWDELSESQRRRLAEQLRAVDLPGLAEMMGQQVASEPWDELAARAEGPPAIRLATGGRAARGDNRWTAAEARERGEESLRAGQVGMVLVAGGQGTRLGFPHPKGMLPLGPVSGKPLFALLVERLRAVSARYGRTIPLYLMTSPATHDETVRFFEQHQRFGLSAEDLHIFCQGVLPALDDRSGRLLLDDRDQLSLAPDGHGGMLRALVRSQGLEDAARREIEHLFYAQVDNPLAQFGDPVLLGYHLLAGSEMTTQVVRKRHALERVGNVVSVDGAVRIIEYSDLPRWAAMQQHEDGSLKLWAGNIAVHVFARSFLERAAGDSEMLPLHRAHKRVPYLDEQGRRVEPAEPNACKFERFIFDLLPAARNALAVEAAKEEAFAPVKNHNGQPEDTPESAQRQMVGLHARWIREAGGQVDEGVPVEISPLWALDAEDVARKLPKDFRVHVPTLFQ